MQSNRVAILGSDSVPLQVAAVLPLASMRNQHDETAISASQLGSRRKQTFQRSAKGQKSLAGRPGEMRRERKKVEMLFAHLKRILKLDRLRLRGPNGARDEFHLAAAAQNLRKLAKLLPNGPQFRPA